jgi:hypothetical protein
MAYAYMCTRIRADQSETEQASSVCAIGQGRERNRRGTFSTPVPLARFTVRCTTESEAPSPNMSMAMLSMVAFSPSTCKIVATESERKRARTGEQREHA